MSEHEPTGSSPAEYQSPGSYRTNMTALGVRPGVLRATDGRLAFVADDGTVFFDAPLPAFHSVGLAEMDQTLEVWEDRTRHRISLAEGGPLVANMVGPYQSDTNAKRWVAYLKPLVGSVPAGVTVKKPASKGQQVLLAAVIVVAALVLAGVVTFMIG